MSTKLIASAFVGAGVIGGVTLGTYYLLNKKEEEPKSLQQLLISENKTPLNLTGNTDDTIWERLVNKFLLTDSSVTVTKIKANDVADKSPEKDNKHAKNIEKLKASCKLLLEKTKDYSEDKEVAINWCTKESQLLKTG